MRQTTTSVRLLAAEHFRCGRVERRRRTGVVILSLGISALLLRGCRCHDPTGCRPLAVTRSRDRSQRMPSAFDGSREATAGDWRDTARHRETSRDIAEPFPLLVLVCKV